MAGSGRSNVGTAVVAAIALLVVALPQALLATTQECEETETAGIWTCTPGVTWEESGQTVDETLHVVVPGESTTIAFHPDLYSTTVTMENNRVLKLETPEETLHFNPQLNMLKITRNGSDEELLVSDETDPPYEVGPEFYFRGIQARGPDCMARGLWEWVWGSVLPGETDSTPDRTIQIEGTFTEYFTDGEKDGPYPIPLNRSGPENPAPGNPISISGSEEWEWDVNPPQETRNITVNLWVNETSPDPTNLVNYTETIPSPVLGETCSTVQEE